MFAMTEEDSVCHDPGRESDRRARARFARPRRRNRLELTALESRQVLSGITGYTFVQQSLIPSTLSSNPTIFQTDLTQGWKAIETGAQKVGNPPQTLAQLATAGVQAAAKAEGVSAYNISEGFNPSGNYSANLIQPGPFQILGITFPGVSEPTLAISYVVPGNTLNFTTTTNSIFGSYADPSFRVTYDLDINLDVAFSPNINAANPVTVTGTAQVANAHTTPTNAAASIANFFSSSLTSSISNGINGQSVNLTNLVPTGLLNAALNAEAAQGYSHLKVGLDNTGNLLLTAQSPNPTVVGNTNDTITLTKTANGGLQVVQGGLTTTYDPGYLKSVTIDTGAGKSTVKILSTPAGLTVNLNDGGTDAVTVGNGSLTALGGPVNVNSNVSGKTTLTVDDSADTANPTATITKAAVQFPGAPR